MRNIRLDVAYDGTDYAGWQIQPNAVTVEEEIRKALDKKQIKYEHLIASGRTDSGVHANQHTLNFFTDSKIPDQKIKYALNTVLPETVRIMDSIEVSEEFNARFSSKGKHYIYSIDLNEIQKPLNKRYFWHFPYKIDLDKLYDASTFLTGKHDYNAFMASGSSVQDTNREVYLIKPVLKDNGLLELHFIGNGFLYNMVRILSGTILQYAAGVYPKDKLMNVFREPKRKMAGITAPAHGLRLEEVFYDDERLQNKINSLKLL